VRKLWDTLKRYPALLLLVAVYVASSGVVATNFFRGRGGGPGEQRKKVLRIAHWQLEPGIRDALNWLIGEYEELHPDVQIRQILIPEEGYFRWVNTQLIGRTAPDMIECGLGGSDELWRKFYARYFLLLDEYVEQPNPYNKGTALEETSWRQTYFDDMEGGYEEQLQSYFRVPLSAFTVRLYYNKDMVEAVWPAEQKGAPFPETFEDFLEMCDALRDHARRMYERTGDKKWTEFVPIAGSQYSFERFGQIYRIAMTADYLDRLDVDYDGTVSPMEYSGPFYSGQMSMLEPAIQGHFGIMRQIAEESPPGATSMDRDQAQFLFVQRRAAMIPTGSWDYSSLATGTEFEVAVADFPLPSRDHPEYGPYVAGQPSEADTRGAFPFAIAKFSSYPEAALDFLRFASSLKNNEELNRRMCWIPVIRGAGLRPELKPFRPRVEGFSSALEYYGPNTKLAYDQHEPLYLSGAQDYQLFVKEYVKEYRPDLEKGVDDHIRDMEQTLDQQLRFAGLRRAALVGAPGATDAVTGEASKQLRRIIEAYGGQRNARDHAIRVWLKHARLWAEQEQAEEEEQD
jgi:raffinose/stachyose/melibiose transport system substrate-binding protein